MRVSTDACKLPDLLLNRFEVLQSRDNLTPDANSGTFDPVKLEEFLFENVCISGPIFSGPAVPSH